MRRLFDQEYNSPDLAWLNLRSGSRPTEKQIREQLEEMWTRYHPYADSQFQELFARSPDERFWEMYLAVQLLDGGKELLERRAVTKAERDTGPDICVLEDGGKIWIEAVCPGRGDAANRDRVPEIRALSEMPDLNNAMAVVPPKREVELRVASAVAAKHEKFADYRARSLVDVADRCVVAVNGGHFWAESASGIFPLAVSALYPVGSLQVIFETTDMSVETLALSSSELIERNGRLGIPRSALIDQSFCSLAGVIWSRRTIGNFFWQGHDFVYLHHPTSSAALPFNWFSWEKEFSFDLDRNGLVVISVVPETVSAF
jgi:hypothetical protein